MINIRDLSIWLEKQVKFLIKNQDYVGSWKKIDEYYCFVVLWEEGFGREEREDVIQLKDNRDYALVAGIKIYENNNTVDYWMYPWTNEDEMVAVETTSISQNENYVSLAKYLLTNYEKYLKDTVPGPNGSIDYSYDEPPPHAVELDVDEALKNKSLKEARNDFLLTTNWVKEMEYRLDYYRENPQEYKDDDILSILQYLTDKEWEELYRELANGIVDSNHLWDVVGDYVNDNFIDIIRDKYNGDPRRLTAVLDEGINMDTSDPDLNVLDTDEQIKQLNIEIERILTQNNISFEEFDIDESTIYVKDNGYVLYIDIYGDWKHDHLRLRNIIKNLIVDSGFIQDSYEVEENSSDDNTGGDEYGAKHYWYFHV